MRQRAGNRWQENGLVFASEVGTELDRHNVLREFRRILKAAGLTPEDRTPRELRHSFVSLFSDAKCQSKSSHAWLGTAARLSLNGSTDTRSDR